MSVRIGGGGGESCHFVHVFSCVCGLFDLLFGVECLQQSDLTHVRISNLNLLTHLGLSYK